MQATDTAKQISRRVSVACGFGDISRSLADDRFAGAATHTSVRLIGFEKAEFISHIECFLRVLTCHIGYSLIYRTGSREEKIVAKISRNNDFFGFFIAVIERS